MKKVLISSLIMLVLSTPFFLTAFSKDTIAKTMKSNKAASLIVAFDSVIMTVDPTSQSDNDIIRRNVFDSMIDVGKDGKITPGIASWEALDGGKIMEFKLQEGIKFSSGDPLTAKDVEFTFNRWHSLPNAMPLDNFEKLEVVDDYTVRYYFSQPSVRFYALCTGSFGFAVTSKDYFDRVGENAFKMAPVGTGPYKIVDWQEGQYVDLEYNEYYWGEKPQIEKVRFLQVTDSSTRVAMLQAGEVDIIMNTPWPTVPGLENDFKRVDNYIAKSVCLSFDLINPDTPWSNVNVRKAINYAIDKESLINNLFHGVPAQTAWEKPWELGYDASMQPAYPYDLDKAKQLMAEAGYSGGFDMPVYYLTNNTGAKDISDYLSSTFKALKINCKLIPAQMGPQYMANVMGWHKDTKAEVTIVGFVSIGNSDPIQTLQVTSWSGNPTSMYSRPDLDKIIEQINATPLDDPKRGELIHEAYEIINADLPYIPIMLVNSVFMMNKNIQFAPINYAYPDAMLLAKWVTVN